MAIDFSAERGLKQNEGEQKENASPSFAQQLRHQGDQAPQQVEEEASHLQSIERGYLQNRVLLNRAMGDDVEAEQLKLRLAELPKRRFESFSEDVDDLMDFGGFAIERTEEQLSTFLGLLGIGGVTLATGGGALMAGTLTAAGTAPLHYGESREALLEAGIDREDTFIKAAPSAIVNTAVDVVGLMKVTKLLGLGKYLGLEKNINKVIQDTGKDILAKRIAKGVGSVGGAAALEGTVEITQDTVNQINAAVWADPEVREKILEKIKDGDEKVETFMSAFASTLVLGGGAKIALPGDKKKEEIENVKGDVKKEATPDEPVIKKPIEEKEPQTPDEIQEEIPVVGKDITEVPEAFLSVEENTDEGPKYTFVDLRKQNIPDKKEAQNLLKEIAIDVEKLEQDIDDLSISPEVKDYMQDKVTRNFGNILNGSYLANVFKGANLLNLTDITSHVFKQTDGNIQGIVQIEKENNKGVYSNLDDVILSTEGEALQIPTETAQALQKMVTAFQAQYMPDSNIYLVPSNASSFQSGGVGAKVQTFTGDNGVFSVIDINLEGSKLQDVVDSVDGDMSSPLVTKNLMSDLMHEVGHAFLAARVKQMPVNLRKALIKDYLNNLEKIVKGNVTVKEFLKSRVTADAYSSIEDSFTKTTLNSPANEWISKNPNSSYLLNIEEFFAEKISEAYFRTNPDKTVKGLEYFTEAIHKIKEFVVKFFGVKVGNDIYDQILDTTRKQIKLNDTIPNHDSEMFKTQLKETLGLGKIIDIPEGRLWSAEYDNALMYGYPEVIMNTSQNIASFDKQYRVSTGFNKWKAYIMSPSQIARRYRFASAIEYMKEVAKYAATKMQGISRADELAKAWNSLSSEMGGNLSKYLFKVSEMSDTKNRKLTPREKQLIAEEFGVTPEVMELAEEIEASFQEVLARTRAATEKDIAKTFIHDPEGFLKAYKSAKTPKEKKDIVMAWVAEDEQLAITLITELGTVAKQFTQLENKNYFPRMRFGDYLVIVKELDEAGNEGKTVTYEAFETKKEYEARLHELQTKYKSKDSGFAVRGLLLDDTAKSLWGMPQIVVDRIEKTLKTVGAGLTREQQEALKAIALDLSPGKRHLRQMKKRMHIKGASKDGIRTYATYMSNASNHLARVEHASDLVALLRDVEKQPKQFEGDNTDLSAAANYYREHFKYLMNPENDWAGLRNIGFLWYLGFNVKSALVNLSQLPMVTYPWLSARYGDTKAVRALTRAMSDISAHLLTQKKFSQEEQAMLDQLERDGVTNESQAMELSSLSNSTILARMTRAKGINRKWGQFTYAAGWMFSAMEGYNRKVNALAAYRLSKGAGNTHKLSVDKAAESVRQTQFEYAKWDRAELMRGRKSAAFLFMNYTQNFLYTAFNGDKNTQGRATALRMMGVMFLFAGLQGLPGAEYFLSMIDFLGTNFKKFFGMKDPKVESRKALREYLNHAFYSSGMDLNSSKVASDLFLHGGSRYGFGGGLLSRQLFGTPLDIDLSGSLSMGAPLQFGRTTDRDGYGLEDFLLEATGPIGNVVANAWDAGISHDPDMWKRSEKLMPIAFKNVSKGIRYYDRGKETFKGGGQFAEMDNNAENFFQALGFTPTQLAQKRQIFGEQMEASMYWKNKRNYLITQYVLAIELKDFEGVKKAREEITEYNKTLKSKETRKYSITAKELMKSKKTRLKNNKKKAQGLPLDKRDRPLFKDIENRYPSR